MEWHSHAFFIKITPGTAVYSYAIGTVLYYCFYCLWIYYSFFPLPISEPFFMRLSSYTSADRFVLDTVVWAI